MLPKTVLKNIAYRQIIPELNAAHWYKVLIQGGGQRCTFLDIMEAANASLETVEWKRDRTAQKC